MPICDSRQGAYVDEGINVITIHYQSIFRTKSSTFAGPFPEDDLLVRTLQAYTNMTFDSLEQGNHILDEPSWFVLKVKLEVKNRIIVHTQWTSVWYNDMSEGCTMSLFEDMVASFVAADGAVGRDVEI